MLYHLYLLFFLSVDEVAASQILLEKANIKGIQVSSVEYIMLDLFAVLITLFKEVREGIVENVTHLGKSYQSEVMDLFLLMPVDF